jgi:hypothetical protein
VALRGVETGFDDRPGLGRRSAHAAP